MSFCVFNYIGRKYVYIHESEKRQPSGSRGCIGKQYTFNAVYNGVFYRFIQTPINDVLKRSIDVKQFKILQHNLDNISYAGVDGVEDLKPPRTVKCHLPYEFLPTQLQNGRGKVICAYLPVCRLTSGPYFSYFSLLFDPEPYFSLLLRQQPYYPYFLGCHVIKLNKEHLKHVFLHWFST